MGQCCFDYCDIKDMYNKYFNAHQMEHFIYMQVTAWKLSRCTKKSHDFWMEIISEKKNPMSLEKFAFEKNMHCKVE